ncbi:hypothetical protein SAMN06265222_105141 [Neorhodopirellula lusitana]|uniref:Uncharacterized protein n=1 Tax=Neorhodopirellula lusitana TaxID=445327 RepID=A0ABY1Q401_9BACT|nr:hypothetical protein SAMN06265222_105141 [Neorhodopirellula lusitana]
MKTEGGKAVFAKIPYKNRKRFVFSLGLAPRPRQHGAHEFPPADRMIIRGGNSNRQGGIKAAKESPNVIDIHV